jgi:hypothetical protein
VTSPLSWSSVLDDRPYGPCALPPLWLDRQLVVDRNDDHRKRRPAIVVDERRDAGVFMIE